MSVKASLKIILKADDTIVAESDDSDLWQSVLMAINQGATNVKQILRDEETEEEQGPKTTKDAIDKLAEEFDVTRDQLISACGPSKDEPFIYFDKHHWEAFKKNTPERGTHSIPPRVLALTLLVFWLDIIGENHPTSKDGKKVLDTLKIKDDNVKRSIENCEWLQLRGENIYLNPTQTSKAIQVARGYILKQDPYSNR